MDSMTLCFSLKVTVISLLRLHLFSLTSFTLSQLHLPIQLAWLVCRYVIGYTSYAESKSFRKVVKRYSTPLYICLPRDPPGIPGPGGDRDHVKIIYLLFPLNTIGNVSWKLCSCEECWCSGEKWWGTSTYQSKWTATVRQEVEEEKTVTWYQSKSREI